MPQDANDGQTSSDLSGVQRVADAIRANISQVIVGQTATIDLLLVAVLAGGHVLIEDVPGMGKTVLARALARSLGGDFQRIQCTPDLLPGDITGIMVLNQHEGAFQFRPGPIFAQVVLADEVNRATPRTQSALLEAMAEHQVTIDRETRPLPHPFLLIATQNPVELEGTFPLPEAQLDRFLLRPRMGYPTLDDERTILRRFRTADPLANIPAVTTPQQVSALSRLIGQVRIDTSIEDYLLTIVRSTRSHPGVELGVSPRGALALARAAQALAAIAGRAYVAPDDIKRLARPVLAHRLITNVEARVAGNAGELIIDEIVRQTYVPVEAIPAS